MNASLMSFALLKSLKPAYLVKLVAIQYIWSSNLKLKAPKDILNKVVCISLNIEVVLKKREADALV